MKNKIEKCRLIATHHFCPNGNNIKPFASILCSSCGPKKYGVPIDLVLCEEDNVRKLEEQIRRNNEKHNY